jgi:hypothetical protein
MCIVVPRRRCDVFRRRERRRPVLALWAYFARQALEPNLSLRFLVAIVFFAFLPGLPDASVYARISPVFARLLCLGRLDLFREGEPNARPRLPTTRVIFTVFAISYPPSLVGLTGQFFAHPRGGFDMSESLDPSMSMPHRGRLELYDKADIKASTGFPTRAAQD